MNMLLCAGFGRILPAGHVAGVHPEWIMVPRSAARAALAERGFRFVGPTICYAFMQAVGMVNDHLVTCFRHAELGGRA